jgi:hypothetical protein
VAHRRSLVRQPNVKVLNPRSLGIRIRGGLGLILGGPGLDADRSCIGVFSVVSIDTGVVFNVGFLLFVFSHTARCRQGRGNHPAR